MWNNYNEINISYKKTLIIFIFVACSNLYSFADDPEFIWAKQIRGRLNDDGFKVTSDSTGNLIVVGGFSKGVAIDKTKTKLSSSNTGIFIFKFSEEGQLISKSKIVSNKRLYSSGVVTDNQGNIYVAGAFSGRLRFRKEAFTSFGEIDVFIAKFDSLGKFVWARKIGGADNERARSIALDDEGNIVVAGLFKSKIKIESFELEGTDKYNAFVLAYDSDGQIVWTQECGGEEVRCMTAVKNNNVVMAGNFRGQVDFEKGILNSTQSWSDDIFLAKYDPNGTIKWFTKSGGKGYDYAHDVASDKEGNVYLAG